MADKPARRFWTVPNILSLSRIALLPVFFWLMSQPDRRYWIGGGVLILYGMVSDILDGMLARKLNQVTEAGKIIDPLADKVTSGAVAIFCVVQRGLPIWALAATVIRDLALVAGAKLLWKKKGDIPTSLMIGKLAALFWALNLLLWVFDWRPLADYTLWPTVGLYVITGFIYARRVMKPAK